MKIQNTGKAPGGLGTAHSKRFARFGSAPWLSYGASGSGGPLSRAREGKIEMQGHGGVLQGQEIGSPEILKL